MSHDPIRQLKYFRQNISQNKKPVGFFISAGCPFSIKGSSDEPLIPDVAGLTKKVSEELDGEATYEKLLEELGKAGKSKDNIEDVLSFLRALKTVSHGGEVRGLNEDELTDLEERICSEISELINVDFPDDKTPYHQLVSWINSIDRVKSIQVFTTNYDLLMEKALENNGVPYFDGFVGSHRAFFDLRAVEEDLIPNHWTRLWKIHGSINWDRHENNEVVRISNPSEIDSTLIYPSHLKYDESKKMPYLALIDQLSRFIKHGPSLLILSGYSFNDDHINDVIVNALRANPTANVVALLYGKLSKYDKAIKLAEKRHNLSLWAFDNAVIGTKNDKWEVPTSRALDEDEVYQHSLKSKALKEEDSGATKKYTLELGNFIVLGKYLQSMIGEIESEKS
ncbi:MAG: SIR2 family protein [Balneola sp.]